MFSYIKHVNSYIKHVSSYIKGGYKACYEPTVFQQNKVTLHVYFVKGFVVAIPAFQKYQIYCISFHNLFCYFLLVLNESRVYRRHRISIIGN